MYLGPHHKGLTIMRMLSTGNEEGSMGLIVLRVRPTLSIPRWTTHVCFLYQVYDTCGATQLMEAKGLINIVRVHVCLMRQFTCTVYGC